MMDDLIGSFIGNVSVRVKHIGKTCNDLWGESTILLLVSVRVPGRVEAL